MAAMAGLWCLSSARPVKRSENNAVFLDLKNATYLTKEVTVSRNEVNSLNSGLYID